MRAFPRAITVSILLVALAALSLTAGRGQAADWPMWRYDAARTAQSPESLPDVLHLQWVRKYPPLKPAFWQARQERLQFDLGYEPVVAGRTLLVGSSLNDSVTALDTETGRFKWRFFADGPVRFAPAVYEGKVYFASDDGCLYCLTIEGKLLWKRRGAPSDRKVLGNGRLISLWPARGGPVAAGGRVYFTAGIWPLEGIFVSALEAKSGNTVWRNDSSGSMYCMHPHGAMAFGGPSPQGYLLVRDGELVVPGGRSFPAFFDLNTGKLNSFEFGHQGHGSLPGSWFVSTDAAGHMLIDPEINTEIHDAGQQVVGQSGVRPQEGEVMPDEVSVGRKKYKLERGVRSTVSIGGKRHRFDQPPKDVEGKVHTMLAADGKLFVVTRPGGIYCFGPKPAEPKVYEIQREPLASPTDQWTAKAKTILTLTGAKRGYALVLGLGTGRLVEELVRQSELRVIVVEPDSAKVDGFRRRLDRAGLYGPRVAIHAGNPTDFGFPPYMAKLIVAEDAEAVGVASSKSSIDKIFRWLRPYGGTLCIELSANKHQSMVVLAKTAEMAGGAVSRKGEFSLIVKPGPLPGAANYTGQPNDDRLAKAPLGILWFGDTFHHHKLYYKTYYYEIGRGLPATIDVVDGVMRYLVSEKPCGPNPKGVGYYQYLRLLEQQKTYFDAFTDVYTGRTLSDEEADRVPFSREAKPVVTAQDWIEPTIASRKNPLTGVMEGRELMKTYGCDRVVADYGNLLTYRSGTAAFYDKRSESGTININGVRSGCRNSIVPACGVLSLPSWTGNCTCNYSLTTSLALVHMPEQYEQWSAWGDVAVEAPVRRVGINFGAPGDRVTEDGTLWLDYPSVGGPSPTVPVTINPNDAKPYYRHSLRIEKGSSGWPWVVASGVEGVRSVSIVPVTKRSAATANGSFSVRWSGHIVPPLGREYTFHVLTDHGVRLWVDGKLLIDNARQLRRGNQGELTASATLEAGRKYALTMEYYHRQTGKDAAPAVAQLSWSAADVAKSVVPGDRLLTIDGKPGGLTAAYHEHDSFGGPAVLRTDPQINFDWGLKLPAPLDRSERSVVLPERTYKVALYFAEPENLKPGQRVFSVKIQGRMVLENFDIVAAAGGPRRGVVRQFEGVGVKDALSVEFISTTKKPALVCGLKLTAE